MYRHLRICAPMAIACWTAFMGCAQSDHLGRGEQVVFFPTVGYEAQGGSEWVVPVRGRVYESSWMSRHLSWAGHVLDIESFIEDPTERATLRERLTPFLVNGNKGREVRIVMGDQLFRLSPALDRGHFYDELRIPADQLASAQMTGTPNARVLQYHAAVSNSDPREYTGRVYLLPPEGLSIVSDIDDTIRITDVNNTKKMVKNTFVEPFHPVPGMAELFHEWAEQGAQFHYLSATPAPLLAPMEEFLRDNYPEGSLTLRTAGHEQSTLKLVMQMFDAPIEYKSSELTWLMRALPNRRYVLIGDSGQNDPEVYGLIARVFRPQVQFILIRDVTCCEDRFSPRYQAAFRDLPNNMWILFREPGEVRSKIRQTLQQRTPPQNHSTPLWGEVFTQQVAAYK